MHVNANSYNLMSSFESKLNVGALKLHMLEIYPHLLGNYFVFCRNKFEMTLMVVLLIKWFLHISLQFSFEIINHMLNCVFPFISVIHCNSLEYPKITLKTGIELILGVVSALYLLLSVSSNKCYYTNSGVTDDHWFCLEIHLDWHLIYKNSTETEF